MNKQTNKRIITFGTFDLFHIGHLNILIKASKLGKHLTVGVSSDKLNFSKKNIYPVYPQADRLKIIKALEYVDDVFIEESLELKEQYIIEYKSDILVMGNDWEGKFDYLSQHCKVIYFPRTVGISTSDTKNNIHLNIKKTT